MKIIISGTVEAPPLVVLRALLEPIMKKHDLSWWWYEIDGKIYQAMRDEPDECVIESPTETQLKIMKIAKDLYDLTVL